MASNSPESPSKKRKHSVNGLKRDQPLFTGRRPQRALQQPPEFFTDSLNTSYIPSPSPPKSPTYPNVRAKPRQTLGNGRSLGAAFKPTPRVNDENRPPSSSSSSDRRRLQRTLKPRPAQGGLGARSVAPEKPTRSPVRARTPTPPRGRSASFTSPPNPDSSPARGYAEAYQRINEEENLAHEDSIEDLEDIVEGYEPDQQDRSENLSPSRFRRLQRSKSPTPRKDSRMASPNGVVDADAPAVDDEEDAGHLSDNESGMENTENITDTSMDSGSSQYAKDLQRLGALKNGTKAFSKSRVGGKVGHTLDNLQRRNGSNESLGSSFSAGSLSNKGSDPSINVPKAWGRKAKPSRDWLARINSKSGRFTGDVPKRHSSGDQMIAENQQREWSEPIDQWIASAAEVPVPSSEDGPLNTGDSQGSTPTTAIPRPKSLDRRRQWEMNDDEFTGRSLQISESPPIRMRNATLDRMREREMENLEKRAVTTNRLGELREKSSGESLRRSKSNKSIESLQDERNTIQEPKADPVRRPSSSAARLADVQETHEDATPEDSIQEGGEPVPDTPVVIYKNNSHDGTISDQVNGKGSDDGKQLLRRPSHERKDSHDLLKRLARVTSESPSPTRHNAESTQSLKQPESNEQVDETPQPSRSATNVKTPVVTGAWVDQTLGETPKVLGPNANLKTPLVTGAWVDTPLPTGGRGPPMPTPSDQEEHKELNAGKVGAAELIHRLNPNTITSRPKLQSQAPLQYSGPPLGKSALEDILKDARSIKMDQPGPSQPRRESDSEEDPTLHLGESTIQSLEELIANDEDFSTLLAPTPPSPQTSDNPSSDPSPSSQAVSTSTATTRSSRITDLQSYTHLLSRLTTLGPSLRASKKRIETLERAVATVPTSANGNIIPPPEAANICNEAGSLHDFLFPCQTCGCPGSGGSSPNTRLDPTELENLLRLRESLTTITLPIPRLWHWDRQHPWRPRLTWLGLILFTAYGCYLVEDYARFKFCHPLYATHMVGYGVDIDAPKPPFVAFKVLARYTVVGRVVPFLRLLVSLVMSVVGWFVGFVFGGSEGSNGGVPTRVPVSRDARIPRPAWGPDLSLMDDEYL
ncbi:hypothetical protein ACLMJK_003193 [Lecanora helva]